MYLGDFKKGTVVHLKFATVDSSGVPTALTAGEVAVYSADSTTEDAAVETLTASFDARTGLNHVAIATSSLSRRTDYSAVIIAGTVGGVSVVGYPVGHFSIENRHAPGLISRGVAQAATAGTIQLASGESFPDDLPIGSVIQIVGGTGAGQTRTVTDWATATDTANVSPDWTTTPDNTSEYEWLAAPPAVTSSLPQVDVRKINNAQVYGAGTGADLWRATP